MQSIQTSHTTSLSAVKPFDGLLTYRAHCLTMTKQALARESHPRRTCPVDDTPLVPWEAVEEIPYHRCPHCDSRLVAMLPSPEAWQSLLDEVSRYRHSAQAFHSALAQSRATNVVEPKIQWIQNALRLAGCKRPVVMEVMTPPSDSAPLLTQSGLFDQVIGIPEMDLLRGTVISQRVDAVILFESLDRIADPMALLQRVNSVLSKTGLLFVTSLVASGFDMGVLGARNAYLYPPDRANCFSLAGLTALLQRAGSQLVEVSTPGVLDLEVVRAHRDHDPRLPLAPFVEQLLAADARAHEAFQAFLQQSNMSSFARIVARRGVPQ